MARLGLRVFFVLSLAGGVWLNSFAADKPATNSPAPAPAQKVQPTNTKKTKAPKTLKYRGEISAVDTTKGAVSVKGEAGEKRFMTQDSAKDTLERLAVGDTVRVTYLEKDKTLIANSVRRLKVKSTKPASSPAAPSKSAPREKISKTQVK